MSTTGNARHRGGSILLIFLSVILLPDMDPPLHTSSKPEDPGANNCYEPFHPEQQVTLQGVAINYSLSRAPGPEEPVVVLLHGFGASIQTWYDLHPFLETRYPVLRLDLKGFGFSSKIQDGRYSLEDQADLVVALIRELHFKRIVLVGHSYGGAVALLTVLSPRTHGNGPDIVGLILIDSAGYTQRLPFFVRHLRNPFTSFFTFNLMSPRARAKHVLKKIFYSKARVTPARIHRYAFFFGLAGSEDALRAAALQIVPDQPERFIDRLKEISVPTLIIWGRQDSVIPVSHAHRFQADIRGSELYLVDWCGHVPHEERPEEVSPRIAAFLEGIK